MINEKNEVQVILNSIQPPEPEIMYESLFGPIWFKNQTKFEKKYIETKDGRWRKRRFWDK